MCARVRSTLTHLALLDDRMTFDVEIANLGYGESFFYLYSDLLENREGLILSIDGDALNSPATWKLKGKEVGGTSTISTLTVEKGPRWNIYRYDPVKIYLQSKCEFEEEAGFQINDDLVWNVAREEGDGAIARHIEFTRICPEVEFDRDLKRYDGFTTKDETLEVKIRNPLRFRDIRLEDQDRLEKIVLEYRKVSGRSPLWNKAKNTDGEELNFLDGSEDSFGYISSVWKLPSLDASYEVRLKSICTGEPTAPLRLNRFISESLVGIVDRAPPSVFGVPTPSVNLFPGEELVIQFTEDIEVN